MPTNLVKELIHRLETLENKMHLHLEESGNIKTDIVWIKRSLWGLLAIGTTALGAVLRFIALHVQWH